MTASSKPLPAWLRVLRVSWAVLLAVLLVFSILMAAWGDLRESLMLRLLDDRHAKSFLLQFPEGTRVWAGGEALGTSRLHPLAQGEAEDSALAIEGMRVVLPRAYLMEKQMLAEGIQWTQGDHAMQLATRLAPDAEIIWIEQSPALKPFTPVVLGQGARIDYALLCALSLPAHDANPARVAFLLRAEHEGARVFYLQGQEEWSDRLWAPEGTFWAQREQVDGPPRDLSGQVKSVFRWYFRFEADEKAWREAILPRAWADALWTELPAE